MSSAARRKNRRGGLKKGFRRENGRTPRHKVRPLRERACSPEVPGGATVGALIGGRAR
ncbi:hypothetical protein STBA_40090 [Streptomyces sp. MP131-18]|nr:hypothetical protein STBA_40090 [Streptomyces sp. MP131-18]